jgi:hypothetical protein
MFHLKPAGGSMARALLLLGISLGALGAAVQAQSIPLTSGPVLPLYRALRNVGLDPQRVFQIREAEINREDVHIWLNDGTIAFTQSVDGKVTGAYFEGEGEVLVRPPDRMERASLGLVPQVRVPILDANLGSLTLTTDITFSLAPSMYNSSGCQTARRLCTWPPLHPISRPSPCPRTPISR